MIYVGTSGFSYPEWKKIFYPERLSTKEYLSFYGARFRTTEINNTFYRSPSSEMCSTWATQVPADFRFALKVNRKVTHQKKLQNVDEEMSWFLRGASSLGDKLGPLLVQLPPFFRKNLEALESFLEKFSSRISIALEFRHQSWMSEDVFELLEKHRSALVLAQTDEQEADRRVTAPFLYLRLRKSSYASSELQEWARWIESQQGDTYAYLKHDTQAPALAQELVELLG